jgi:hypothetical protein
MNETSKNYQPFRFGQFFHWLFRRRTQGRVLIGLAALVTFVAIFYLEEDWRGWHAWQICKRELEAKGVVLDWNACIPPPVPDDQNFFAAPKMQEWFVRHNVGVTTELHAIVTNADKIAVITDKTAAAKFLAWSDQFQPQFNQIREALKRPYARMEGDYSQPYEIPIPNFVMMRALAQVLQQRAKCNLLLGQPEEALRDVTLMHDACRLLEGAPTGKPMPLVSAMINVAVTGLYAETIAGGLQSRAWQEPQLAAMQNQLEQINLPSIVAKAFESQPAAIVRTLETISIAKLEGWFSSSDKISLWQRIKNLKWKLMPRGWIYQNMATSAKLVHQQTRGFDSANDIIQPKKIGGLTRQLDAIAVPYKFIAAESIPNFTKAWQTTAFNQTLVNEAQIVCALERYRLARGEYPETLDALTPQFIEKLPHDIINGQPLHYRRTPDGKFLLYSVGWNETDDGGASVGDDLTKGDWVWKN